MWYTIIPHTLCAVPYTLSFVEIKIGIMEGMQGLRGLDESRPT